MYTDREEFEGWMERIMERFDRTEKLLERVLKKNNTLDGEEVLERIMTQKWISNFLVGIESWCDYRRTGYPRLMPATEDGNKSLGVVDSELGARRMPYPADEYTTNNVNVNNAVSSLLKGTDNMATRMWWDCNPAIK